MMKEFMRASRFRVLPVMIIPVVLGALGAWAWHGMFNILLFLITLIGAGAAHLFSNMVNDLWDYKNGTDEAAQNKQGAISTNSGFLTNGTWSLEKFKKATWFLFILAIGCGILLSIFSGIWAFIFGLLGGLIAYFYVAPPIRFGYRGKGYSEIAILLSFGVLPVAGAYYVQTAELNGDALLLSLPIGLLTTLILFNHHFLHWQADKDAGKRTLIVVWGEKKALMFSKMLLILAYLSLIGCVIYGTLPLYGLIALVTAVPLFTVYSKLADQNESAAYLPLMAGSLKTTVRCGAILILVLIVQALMR